MRKNLKKLVVLSLVGVSFGGAVMPTVSNGVVYASEQNNSLSKYDVESIKPFLEILETIPDELLLNGTGKEINDYFSTRGIKTNFYNDRLGEVEPILNNYMNVSGFRANLFWCLASITSVIAGVAIPITKIAKIKKYVEALGGFFEAAKLLISGATFAEEKLTVLKSLMSELLGIKGIQDNCFG
ncbi:hypothetical protein KG091_08915 [Carnobacteriaceae bacterium zg-ZUI78]|nr:hypothetical protein [Carnobacteriaceae bacterium zg-ZUI78]